MLRVPLDTVAESREKPGRVARPFTAASGFSRPGVNVRRGASPRPTLLPGEYLVEREVDRRLDNR